MEVGKREIFFSFFFCKVDVGEMCESFHQMSCHILGMRRVFREPLDVFFGRLASFTSQMILLMVQKSNNQLIGGR